MQYIIQKRYKSYYKHPYIEREWTDWFNSFSDFDISDDIKVLEERIKEYKKDKTSVNKKQKIEEDYQIVEYIETEFVPPVKKKRGRKKKTEE